MRTDRKELFRVRFEQHYPRLCSIAYGYVSDYDESEDVFLMAKLKGMKYREIANELGISEKTVDNQMTKAVKLLRAYAAENPFLMTAIGAIVLSILVNCK